MRAAAVSDPGPPRLPLRKAESDREILVFVPLTIAYLEQVKLEISVTKQHADVRYVLSVHHAKINRTWRHLRSFDEYRKLQQRLLKVLAHGHFCSADCPWMFTFLKSYFPKKHLFFHFSSARVIAARKVALEKLLLAVQQFLLNRANHNCAIMTTAFANEVVEFIYGDQILTQYPLEHLTKVQLSPSGVSSSSAGSAAFAATRICSRRRQGITDSLVSSTSDECDIGAVAVEDDDDICQICDSSLYGEAFAEKHERTNSFVTNSESSDGESSSSFMDVMGPSASTFAVTSALAALSIRPASPTSTSTLSSSGTTSSYRRRNTYYVTTLGCGHQFHDECIVPKLNETLRCPTCNHLEVTT
uniref:RING-type domain-containing protein n=1 Tax=Globisporangium ultimum (strain ATCC 200006 / CBS 805.95 / DAOM BR144) TaxID=431595 RepID=K3WXD3_GLOUD